MQISPQLLARYPLLRNKMYRTKMSCKSFLLLLLVFQQNLSNNPPLEKLINEKLSEETDFTGKVEQVKV